jgi:hypothetical protein
MVAWLWFSPVWWWLSPVWWWLGCGLVRSCGCLVRSGVGLVWSACGLVRSGGGLVRSGEGWGERGPPPPPPPPPPPNHPPSHSPHFHPIPPHPREDQEGTGGMMFRNSMLVLHMARNPLLQVPPMRCKCLAKPHVPSKVRATPDKGFRHRCQAHRLIYDAQVISLIVASWGHSEWSDGDADSFLFWFCVCL